VSLASLWLLIQVPLVYLGSWYGYVKAQAWQHPTKTHSIPRQIPPQSWHTRSLQVGLLAGLVPFAVLFIELMFVFKSLWQDKSGYYYVFGFLSVVSTILIITISEVTIIATYIQLCSEVSDWLPSNSTSHQLIVHRTTIGGGRASSWAEAVLSGSSSTASGTTPLDCIFRASYRASSSSATASSPAWCMGS
jgi:Endomembrane protein 70